MIKDFVHYEESLKLKELGFDEPCLAYYEGNELTHGMLNDIGKKRYLQTPMYSQAFRWFRDNYGLFGTIKIDQTTEPKFWFSTVRYESTQFCEGWYDDEPSSLYYYYEEAELNCLRKLIELAEQLG